ncbi:MAG TPA: preprotein translocase subunit SecE [Acidimicrobiales bacterium]|nr:preprotein translocase subunit SecE [Acidimicrobiales bacterium]
MNRQHRRLAQRPGEEAEQGLDAPVDVEPDDRRSVSRPAAPATNRRTSPRQFLHEVNVELRKVVWPSKQETANYSIVVFIALAVLMALVFGLDLGFSKLASYLFK